jgi:hypothetical protein
MKYLTEEKLRREIIIEYETIKSLKRSIENLTTQIAYHRGKLEYLVGLSANQTKINFDEDDKQN